MESKKSVAAKLSKIRPIAPEFSKNEILQILQENDYDVDKTISDFVEERAEEMLNAQWQDAATNSSKAKRKNKVNKNKDKNEGNKPNNKPIANGVASENEISQKSSKKHLVKPQDIDESITTDSQKAAVVLKHMLTKPTPVSDKPTPSAPAPPPSDADSSAAALKRKPLVKETDKNPISRMASHPKTTSDSSSKAKGNQRNRKGQRNAPTDMQAGDAEQENSEKYRQLEDKTQSSAAVDKLMKERKALTANKKKGLMRTNAMQNRKSIDKSSRDLQRCSASFGRYRTLLKEEFEESYKRLKAAFEEMTSALMDREIQLMRTLDTRKEDSIALLSKRERKAAALKKRIDRVDGLTPLKLNELRNDIKLFVSEPRFEEDLGKSVRFLCDKESATKLLANFGELAPVKNLSVGHHRERYESTTSNASIPPLVAHHTDHNHHQPSPLATVEASHEPPASTNRSTSWADSVDSHPLQENRASWAVDTPFVTSGTATSGNVRPDYDRKNQRNKFRRDKKKGSNPENNEKPSDSKNPPEEGKPTASSTQSRDLPKENNVSKSPQKTSDVNKFARNRNERPASQAEEQSGEFQKDVASDGRSRNYYPRGGSGYRGSYRGSQRGGYFQRGGYQSRPYNRPRYSVNQRLNERYEDSDPANMPQNKRQDRFPPRNNQRRDGANPQNHQGDHQPTSQSHQSEGGDQRKDSNPPSRNFQRKVESNPPSRNLERNGESNPPEHGGQGIEKGSKPISSRNIQRDRRPRNQEGNPRSGKDGRDNPPSHQSDGDHQRKDSNPPSRNFQRKAESNPPEHGDQAIEKGSKPLPPRNFQNNRRYRNQEGNPRSDKDNRDNPPPLASKTMEEHKGQTEQM